MAATVHVYICLEWLNGTIMIIYVYISGMVEWNLFMKSVI